MTRVAFELRIAPELVEEYVRRHTPVWPEMLAEIAAAGRRNYSLFLGDGGRLFGYYETDDDEAAQAYLAASPVASRWEASMAEFFVGLEGRADQAATPLTEVFHLQDQLSAARAGASGPAHPEAQSDAATHTHTGARTGSDTDAGTHSSTDTATRTDTDTDTESTAS